MKVLLWIVVALVAVFSQASQALLAKKLALLSAGGLGGVINSKLGGYSGGAYNQNNNYNGGALYRPVHNVGYSNTGGYGGQSYSGGYGGQSYAGGYGGQSYAGRYDGGQIVKIIKVIIPNTAGSSSRALGGGGGVGGFAAGYNGGFTTEYSLGTNLAAVPSPQTVFTQQNIATPVQVRPHAPISVPLPAVQVPAQAPPLQAPERISTIHLIIGKGTVNVGSGYLSSPSSSSSTFSSSNSSPGYGALSSVYGVPPVITSGSEFASNGAAWNTAGGC